MDFVTALTECKGLDAICIVVDQLSKMWNFVPFRTTIDARGLPELFLNQMVRLHGLPKMIISNRGPQCTAVFWNRLCEQLGVNRRL